MHGPSDAEWYERVSGDWPIAATTMIGPALDAETVLVLDMLQHHGFVKLD